MDKPQVVDREQWLAARQALLEKEKDFNRLRDDITSQRQQLPWVKVNEDYQFEGEQGSKALGELFDGKSQLVVYHFMLGPDWEEGCPSCSFWADNYDGVTTHLAHRDIKLVAVSRAPLERILQYRKRMGWSFDWYSSLNNQFNFDYSVGFTPEQQQSEDNNYNFGTMKFNMDEAPGLSVFIRDEEGNIYHSYSTYARGLDMFNAAYHIMDVTPKGRDEDGLPYTMAWLRRHDQYDV